MESEKRQLADALWRIYNRPNRPTPFAYGGNLPWDDPDFSRRMLRYHLDDNENAATRVPHERAAIIAWLWERLSLDSAESLLDITCGPGLYAVPLAQRGLHVTGIDFGPASIEHARAQAQQHGVVDRTRFRLENVHEAELGDEAFDAALILYGQLAVMSKAQAHSLLTRTARALRPGGRLAIELLNQDNVDRKNSSWWYTDDSGLWGDAPYLHLGERIWYDEQKLSLERFFIMHLESGRFDEILLCDQTYSIREMRDLLIEAGFSHVDTFTAWEDVALYDASEWVVYTARK